MSLERHNCVNNWTKKVYTTKLVPVLSDDGP